jgi:hypothetical protein
MSETINCFQLSKDFFLFFDIFYKNNKIYLIMPIYDCPYSPEEFKLIINDNQLNISERYVKNTYEPSLIYVYDYESNNNTIKVDVLFKNIVKSYNLDHIIVDKNNKKFLTITTLFKNDIKLFSLFYNYYKKQGVSHFYIYYNGEITPILRKLFNKKYNINNDITLIEWNFPYWNPKNIKYSHHAQMGQMHHSIYRYGKDMSEYMIFCDLDEYLHTPNDNESNRNMKLDEYIISKKDIDIFAFCIVWSKQLDDDNKIPNELPNKILITDPLNYCDRSKNIFKLSSIKTIGIHYLKEEDDTNGYSNLKEILNLKLYHFAYWGKNDRRELKLDFKYIIDSNFNT